MIPPIAANTCRECLRRPLPYIAAASIVTLSIASQLLHRFSFGAGALEATNLAISAAMLTAVAVATFVGTGLVRVDLERGTLALLLSQPTGLMSYVLGRSLGLVGALLAASCLAAGGSALGLVLTDAPRDAFSLPLVLGWVRVALAVPLLATAALAASAAASRVFAPVLFLALFLAGDVAAPTVLGRLLPSFGLFGLDAGANPSLLWLGMYALACSVVFLATTYLQLALRSPAKTES